MTDSKKTKTRTIVWTLAILVLLYFLVSWLVMGTIVYSQPLRTFTKSESVDRGFWVDKKLSLHFTGDSAIKYKDNFTIWFDKCKTATQLGLIPLYRTTTNDSLLIFNIEPKNNLDNWCLKFNNDADFLAISVHGQSREVKSTNDSLTIHFFHCDASETKQIGTLTATWE